MTWIKTVTPKESPAIARTMEAIAEAYPAEYSPARRAERRVPDIVKNDNIMLAHSLIPEAMKHFFAAYGALLDPKLPLGRRQHELIAAVVSATNQCFY
jgi:hypothetical protein